MAALSKKLRSIEGGLISFFCPGCDDWHVLNVDNPHHPRWQFNGDVERPSFEPSICVTYPANPDAEEEFKEWRVERRCHSFVRGGRIQFLDDCTHQLAGQTVDLPDHDDVIGVA